MGEAGLPHELPFPLTDTDRYVLSQTDEEYKYHDWAELKNIIETNNLSVLKRKPSDLRRYIRWSAATRNEYGSMTKYLLVNRLPRAWGEPPFSPMSQTPFQDPSDYRVLVNDWPYGFTAGIVHIVVWSRTIIPTDPTTGDMTPESRKIVADFVESYFVDRLGPGGQEKVLWFKNWVALQSVRALEHIHVMVRDVPAEIVQEWAQEQACHKLDGTAGS